MPIQLHFTNDEMLAAGDPPLHTEGTIVNLVLTLFGEMDTTVVPPIPRLRVRVGIDLLGLADLLTEDDQALILETLDNIAKVHLPISLGAITALLGDTPPPVTNVGISIDVPAESSGHATRLGVRWERFAGPNRCRRRRCSRPGHPPHPRSSRRRCGGRPCGSGPDHRPGRSERGSGGRNDGARPAVPRYQVDQQVDRPPW